MAITLNTTGKTLELVTSSSATVHVSVSYIDTDSTFVPKESDAVVSSATTTAILAAPISNHYHGAKNISIFNTSASASNTVTVNLNHSSTLVTLAKATLAPGESLQWSDASGWYCLDSVGRMKAVASEFTSYGGRSTWFYKATTAPDAAGYWYCSSKDSGAPGAWAPGSPGMSGRVTDGTNSADYGCIPVANPSTGANYITSLDMSSSQTGYQMLFDCLWVNSGLAVTTTTAQTVNSVTLPARDANGATNGEGCVIGLLTTTAHTNGAVISNSTVTYTNSQGTGSRTATLTAIVGSQIPATAVIGNLNFFNLAAGDTGVQSIQSITLNTSLGAGAASLMILRPLISRSILLANAGSHSQQPMNPGVRLYNGSCILHCYQATGTGTAVTSGTLIVEER